MSFAAVVLSVTLFATPAMAHDTLPDPGRLPGSFLYPLKMWVEDVGDWFTFGETRTLNRLLDRSSLRLAELRALIDAEESESAQSVEQAYEDVWQEFWSRLDNTEDSVPFAEQATRLSIEHRHAVGSMWEDVDSKMRVYILNGEIRAVRLLLEKNSEEGELMLKEVLIDRIRTFPQTTPDDILALDPLVGLLRTRGEKNVIVLMMDILPAFEDVPASDDRDRIEQHVFRTIRGDLTRYVSASPDDGVVLVRDLLEWALHRVEQSAQRADDVRILKDLGELSVVLGITEESSQGLLSPSAYPAAESLKNILTSISSRLEALPRTGHEAMVNDQRMRIEGVSRILEGSKVREDLARTIPPELLKLFPDLPWKIPAVRSGGIHVPLKDKNKMNDPLDNNLFDFKQPSSLSNLEETLKSRLAPMLPAPGRPTPKMGEDPSVRLQELLKEKSGTLAPSPIDLKTQGMPKVR
ncbi:hypothetical protein HYZ98_00175 [Candidatus Peregrinibacteria bacterium]|nr:hypothetical protein [Candidatus Peregrinibacteria bacterium]